MSQDSQCINAPQKFLNTIIFIYIYIYKSETCKQAGQNPNYYSALIFSYWVFLFTKLPLLSFDLHGSVYCFFPPTVFPLHSHLPPLAILQHRFVLFFLCFFSRQIQPPQIRLPPLAEIAYSSGPPLRRDRFFSLRDLFSSNPISLHPDLGFDACASSSAFSCVIFEPLPDFKYSWNCHCLKKQEGHGNSTKSSTLVGISNPPQINHRGSGLATRHSQPLKDSTSSQRSTSHSPPPNGHRTIRILPPGTLRIAQISIQLQGVQGVASTANIGAFTNIKSRKRTHILKILKPLAIRFAGGSLPLWRPPNNLKQSSASEVRFFSVWRDSKMSITKPLKKLSSVALDLDGTLLNTDGVVRDILKVFLTKYGKQWDGREVGKIVGKTPWEASAAVVEEYNLPCTAEELLSDMNPAFIDQCCNIKALPGANRLVKHLHSHSVPMALASNSSKESVELKISFHQGWNQSFSVIVGGDEVTNGKPSPEIFLEAANRLKAEPPSCLVIEDSVSGVMAGKAAGMAVVAVPSIPKQAHLYSSADEVINSLYDLRPEIWGLPPFEDWVDGTLPLEPWHMGGPVIKGYGRGSKVLGIPTANLSAEGYSELLSEHPSGVFFGWAGLPTRGVFKMVMSIGWNPFFNNSEKTIEPWLLHDFGEDFYGEELRLAVVGYIRPEANFPSLESLVARIHEDGDIARRALDLPMYAKHRNDPYLTSPVSSNSARS